MMKKGMTMLLLLPVLLAFNHPFFVSVTEVEYSSKTKELGIACKVFPDDMEDALRLLSGKQSDLYKGDKALNGATLNTYFQKHFLVKINGKAKAINFLGYEIDKEVAWVYFNIPKLTGVKSVEVVSDLLYTSKPEQSNIIHINIDGKRESFKLMAPQRSALLVR